MTNTVNAKNVLKSIQDAINTRIEHAENDNQRKNFRAELKMYNEAMISSALALEIDLKAISKQIAISDKKDTNYIAVYALQKVRKLLSASALNLTSQLDAYTRTILTNLVFDAQNNKTAYVSLSKSIEFSEFDTQKKMKARYNCNASTASTQASSTRQALKVLNIATVSKNKVNDEFALTESKIALQFKDLILSKAK